MSTTKSPFSPPLLPDEKPRRRWALPVIVLVVVLLPVLAGTLWYLSYRVSGNSTIQRLEAKIKARGEPLTLAELAATYSPIPDQSNGAVLLLAEWKKESPAFWQAFEDGAKSLPDHPSRRYDATLPFLGSDLEHVYRSTILQSSNIVAAENYLRDNKEHLEAVRAAIRYSRFRFPLVITNGLETLLPHLSELKREGLNFCLVALVACERGDVDGTIDAMEDTARTGHTLATEPFLISQLVRLAIYNMVIEASERLLSRRSLSDAQLTRLEALLNQVQATGAPRKALVAERTTCLAAFKLPLDALTRLGPSSNDGSDDSSRVAGQVGAGLWNLTGLRDADQRLMLETFEQAIALVGRDDPEAIEQYEELFHSVGEKALKFPPKILSAILLPAEGKVLPKFETFEARRRSALTAIAVERSRLAHEGHLPAQLDELKPRFLTAVAKDPFDGQPLRFKPLTNGYVIYSVGPNRVDDGGKERTKKYSQKDYDETFTVDR